MNYKSTVPEGVSENWEVKKFIVTEEDEKRQMMRLFSNKGRFVPAGNYTQLIKDGIIIMSDTPDELHDLNFAVYKAKGKCLINGLGLGIITELILQKKEVEFVTVIEISKDVIKLVGNHLLRNGYGCKLNIIHSDAFEYKPPKNSKFGMVWHDIWNDMCSDNLEQMKTLHRRYGRMAEWQGSWGREFIQRWKM